MYYLLVNFVGLCYSVRKWLVLNWRCCNWLHCNQLDLAGHPPANIGGSWYSVHMLKDGGWRVLLRSITDLRRACMTRTSQRQKTLLLQWFLLCKKNASLCICKLPEVCRGLVELIGFPPPPKIDVVFLFQRGPSFLFNLCMITRRYRGTAMAYHVLQC